jgi:short-subunit dehydrogenase
MNIHSTNPQEPRTMSKIVLVTGATAGIGRTTALLLAEQGHHVIATGRKPAELAKVKQEAKGALDTVLLDVTSQPSIDAAVIEVARITGGRGVDVLVNNAGFGVLGPTSEIGDAEMRRQFDTNVFGLMAVTRAFLPKMRERGAGRIINVSSVGGRITLPYFGVYNATKYAVESLSDALRYELRPFGIDVTLIEPGVIRTNFEATAVSGLGGFSTTPYAVAVQKYEQMSKLADKLASDPIVIAKAISRAVRARRPAARYVAPFTTNFVLLASTFLPTRVWDWAMRKVAFLNKSSIAAAAKAQAAATTASPATFVPTQGAKPATTAHAMN